MVELDLDLNLIGLGPSTAAPSHERTDAKPLRSSGKADRRAAAKARPNSRAARAIARKEAKASQTAVAAPASVQNGANAPTPAATKVPTSRGARALARREAKAAEKAAEVSRAATAADNASDRKGKKKLRGKAAKASAVAGAMGAAVPPPAAKGRPQQDQLDEPPKRKHKDSGEGQESDVKKRKVSKGASSTMREPKLGLTFQDMDLHQSLKRQLDFLKFTSSTPIQSVAVPVATGTTPRRDVLLRAPTGSGKTLAFLLPVLHDMLTRGCSREDGTMAVILSPTKELSLQTLKVAQDLTRMAPNIVSGALAGGEKPKSEKARLRKGLALICATPGRMAYHLEHTATFKKDGLRQVVLDEADRLLDMGFEPQVRSIYKQLRDGGPDGPSGTVQTLLVSATLSPAVRRLAEFCLRKGAFWADPEGDGSVFKKNDNAEACEDEDEEDPESAEFIIPKTLTQWYCEVPCKERLPALVAAVLSRARGPSASGRQGQKAIVFFSSNASVDFHHDLFLEARWPTRSGGPKRGSAKKKLRKKDGFIGFQDEMAAEDDEEEDEEEEPEEEEAANAAAAPEAPKLFAETPLFKLHGNLTKDERDGYMADFVANKGGAFLASDAASRGLDFQQIDWVIQYDPPQRMTEYLHRAGRTARIGRKGNSLIFLQPSEMGFLDKLKSRGVTDIKRLEASQLHQSLLSSGAPRELARAKDLPSLMLAVLKRSVEENSGLLQLARAAFLASLRSYRAFPRELREVFNFQDLHVGHFAGSFALRETPKEASRREQAVSKGKGKGKAKGSGRGAGRGSEVGKSKGGGKAAHKGGGRGAGRGGGGPGGGGAAAMPQKRRQLPDVTAEFGA